MGGGFPHQQAQPCRRFGLALKHRGGVRSHLWASCLAAQSGPRLRVMGDRGAFVKPLGDGQEAALRAGGRPDQAGWGEEPSEHWGIFSDGARQEAIPSVPGAYQSFYAQMVLALRDGAPLPVAAEDAIAGLEIIEAAQRSSAQRAVISIAN